MSNDFSHLHVHSDRSTLDGIIRIPELIKYTKELGMSSVALTDHGSLAGWIDFYKAAEKENIKPLLAVEAYVTENEDGLENKDKTKDNYHVIMIAYNNKGLRNLIYLTNQANRYNFYHRPRISIRNLEQGRANGIIATSSCLGSFCKCGTFENNIYSDPESKVRRYFEKFAGLFHNNFYLEIQDNPEIPKQIAYNDWLIKEAKEIGLPLTISSDAHFLKKEDKGTHSLIMAQQTGKTLQEYDSDEDGLKYGDGHYIRSPQEMLDAAKKYNAEAAFYNTLEIANKCNTEITLGEWKTPVFDIEKDEDLPAYLKWQAALNECI